MGAGLFFLIVIAVLFIVGLVVSISAYRSSAPEGLAKKEKEELKSLRRFRDRCDSLAFENKDVDLTAIQLYDLLKQTRKELER